MRNGRVECMKRKENNKGLTLIELLVALAIVSVVVSLAFGFIIHTIRIYTRGSNDSTVQNDAQLTMAQLESLIVNANMGIGLDPTSATPDNKNLYLYYRDYSKTSYEADDGSGNDREVTSVTPYEAIRIYVDSAEGLSFSTYKCEYKNVDDAGNPVSEMSLISDGSDPQVLSKFVKDFTVDLTDLEKKNEMKVTLQFKYSDRNYKTTNTIMLRNKVVGLGNDNAGNYFKVLEETASRNSFDHIELCLTDPTKTEATIDSAGTSAKTYANPFTVKYLDGGNNELGSQQTIWTLVDPTTGVSINRLTGMITISPECTAESFEVCATPLSVINSDKKGTGLDESGNSIYTDSNQKKATVYVKSLKLESTTLSFTDVPNDPKKRTANLTYKVSHMSSAEIAMIHPQVTAGSVLRPTISESPTLGADGSLNFVVTVNRPVNFQGKDFPIEISYTSSNGKTLIATGTVQFSTTGDVQETLDGVYIIAQDSKGTPYTIQSGGADTISSNRGDSLTLELYAKYKKSDGTELTEIVSPDEWSISSSDATKVSISRTGSGYYVIYNVNDSGSNVSVTLSSTYLDDKGETKSGPGINLVFGRVLLYIIGYNYDDSSQSKYPIACGETQNISFEYSGVKEASLFVKNNGQDDLLSISVQGMTASVRAAQKMTTAQTATFGLRDSSGNEISGTECAVTFLAGLPNTYTADGSTSLHMYIPYATDLGRFGTGITTPEADENPVGVTLHTADGKQIVYFNRSEVKDNSNKGADGQVHQYWAVYDGKVYFFDAHSKKWCYNGT